jgi:hypothetical protein
MADGRSVRSARSRYTERLTAATAGKLALREIAELTGKDAEGVIGVARSEDGWVVTVEVVDDRRIPSSADILSAYEAEIGPNGDLLGYRRVRRYARGRTDTHGRW